MSIVSANIRNIIAQKGYKQNAVAQRAGMSQKSLSSMLHGRKVIRADMIPALALALDVEPNDLFVQSGDNDTQKEA